MVVWCGAGGAGGAVRVPRQWYVARFRLILNTTVDITVINVITVLSVTFASSFHILACAISVWYDWACAICVARLGGWACAICVARLCLCHLHSCMCMSVVYGGGVYICMTLVYGGVSVKLVRHCVRLSPSRPPPTQT